jgi:FSR family fosmidomycin resistance protein-like MFS transporter
VSAVALAVPRGLDRRGLGVLSFGRRMSMFAVGGLSGWALGPILATPIVAVVGLRGTAIVALIPLAASLLVVGNLPYLEGFRPTAESHHAARGRAGASDWRGFSAAAAAGTLRTGSLFAFQAFVPLYVWRTLDSSEGAGNAAIAALLAAGAFGTLLGGRLSDVHGFLLGVLADSTSLRVALVGAGSLAVLAALASLLLPQEPS